jgi:HK97 family phage major capsid protein
MNHNELRKICNGKMDRMKVILTAAEADGRELTSDEGREFDRLDNELRAITKLNKNTAGLPNKSEAHDRLTNLEEGLSAIIINPHHVRNFGQSEELGEVWHDRDGNRIRVYNSTESIRAASYSPEYDGLTFGGFLRAAVLGPRNDVERRALAEGTDSAGGFTVAPALLPDFIDKLRAKSTVMRAGARTVVLDTGKTTTIARLASDVSASWRNENAVITPADVSMEGVTFVPRSLAGATLVSRELLDDSANVQQMLENSFAQAFAGEIDRVALLGTGTAPEPRGLKNIINVQTYSMGTNGAQLTDYAPFIEGIALLDTVNAPEPSAAIMSARTMKTISLLKDTTNQPLMRPVRIANLPFLQTSKVPITETQGSASTCSSIYVGDFSQLMIAFRSELRVEILKERYAEYLQYGFLGYLRADINVTHPEAFVRVLGILP